MPRYVDDPVLDYFKQFKFATAPMCAKHLKYSEKEVIERISRLGGKIRRVSRKSSIYVLQDYNRMDEITRKNRLSLIRRVHENHLLMQDLGTSKDIDYGIDEEKIERNGHSYEPGGSLDEGEAGHKDFRKIGQKGTIKDLIGE